MDLGSVAVPNKTLLRDADGKDDEGSIVLTQQPAQEAEEIARIL